MPRVRAAGPAAESALESPAPIIRPRRRGPLGGLAGFVGESWAELRKVDWPNRSQVVQGTVIVLIACLIVGAFLYGADQAVRPFVRDVLLGK